MTVKSGEHTAAIDSLESRLGKLQEDLENKVNKLEAFSRRDNLRFFGVSESANETFDVCARRVVDILCEAMPDKEWKPEDIIRAHRIGDKASGTENSKPRPLIAKFARWADKMDVLTKGREALRRKGIAVSADLTTSQSQTLRKYRKDGINAYYKGDKLVVGGPLRGRGRHADQDSGDNNIGDGAVNINTATATYVNNVNNDNTPSVDLDNQSVASDARANRKDTPRGVQTRNQTRTLANSRDKARASSPTQHDK
nr:hypothetical protein BaRGS_029734 [Batillaria attramentaria]